MLTSRFLDERGQFMHISAMLLLTSMVLLLVVFNIYRVTRAKLQAQNIADAAALAIAALEAKNINVVLDRNEWLNHFYPDGTPRNEHQLVGISDLARHTTGPGIKKTWDTQAQSEATLIMEVNQAQQMFAAAYNQFLGAGQNTSGQNSGPGSLAEILWEIDGLQDPVSPVRLIVFNNTAGQGAADAQAQQFSQQTRDQFTANPPILSPGMAPLSFKTEDVTIEMDNHSHQTLSQVMGQPPNTVGWMRPQWDDKDSTLQVNVSQGQTQSTIGAGVIVIKLVSITAPFVKQVYVQAKSVAYVVQKSGQDVDSQSPDPTKPQPPPHFRPTYYVQLGYR